MQTLEVLCPLSKRAPGRSMGCTRVSSLRAGYIPPDRLKTYLSIFWERSRPERLAGLDGQALLETMHHHANRDTLAYWLEYKNEGVSRPSSKESPGRCADIGSIQAKGDRQLDGRRAQMRRGCRRQKKRCRWRTGTATNGFADAKCSIQQELSRGEDWV